MAATRALSELAEASIDVDWLREIAGLFESTSADGAEAAARLRIFRRAESAFAAARLAETRAVSEHTATAATAADCTPYADLEIAVALNVGEGTARLHAERARLTGACLPRSMARMRDGRITEYHAIRLAELAIDERREHLLAECESEVWEKLDVAGEGCPTVPALMRIARRVMARHDSTAFARTQALAKQTADIRMRSEPGTAMAYLTAYLPLVDAASVMAAVGAYAATAKASGDERRVGQLRADGLRYFADHYLTGCTRTGQPTSHRRPVEVHVVASVETVLGLAETPGELPGHGPVPATEIRTLAREAAVRLLTIDAGNGRLVDRGTMTYRAPADMAATAKARYPLSVAPGCDSPGGRVDLDHRVPHGRGGITSLDNLFPLGRHWHGSKTHGRYAYRVDPATGQITWTTLLGQHARKGPYDYRLGP